MTDLTGKVVLVTGASSGIGAALAREFARRGGRLVLAARRVDRIESLAAELRQAGGEAIACPCDVRRDDDLPRAVSAAHDRFGPIDVAIANAGFVIGGRMPELALDDFQREFETNVSGVLRTVFATLDDLKQTRGRLALMGSVNGYLSFPGIVPYAMSKYAVRALAEGLRAELRPHGVSVTHIAPGLVQSEFTQVDRMGVHHPDAPGPGAFAMPTPLAARKMVNAIARRRRERVVTAHGKLGVWTARFAPGLLSTVFYLNEFLKVRRQAKAAVAAGELHELADEDTPLGLPHS